MTFTATTYVSSVHTSTRERESYGESTAPEDSKRAALDSAKIEYAKLMASVDSELHTQLNAQLKLVTLDSELIHVFGNAIGYEFEDGMESPFSRALVAIVEEHGSIAIKEMTKLVAAKIMDTEVVSESLRWLGSMDDLSTHKERRDFLEGCLSHSSYLVRDGAICGLSALGDASTGAVRSAMLAEPFPQLADDLRQLLDELEHPD